MALDIPLKNVAKSIRNAGSAIAPRSTGNLRNVLRSYNTPERMIKIEKDGSATIKFFTGPPGAKYGEYWNKPYGSGNGRTATIKKRYPQHFDFGDKALKDPEVKTRIKEYSKAVGKQVVTDILAAVRSR